MKVILRHNFFTPVGRFKRSPGRLGPPVDVPDYLRDQLPSTAKIVPDNYVTPEKKIKKVETLSEAASMLGQDPIKASLEAQAKAQEEAEANRQANAKKFQQELADEKAAAVAKAEPKSAKRPVGRPRKHPKAPDRVL